MDINIKLGSALNQYRPLDETSQTFTIQVDPSATVADTINLMGFPEGKGLLVIVNGNLVRENERARTILQDGDLVSLMPPIHAG